MAHLGTHLTPGGRGVAIGKLHQIECILNIGLQLLHRAVGRRVVLELTRQTATHHRQRLGTHRLGKAEVLIEAQTVGLEVVGEEAVAEGVVPTILVRGAVLDRSDRVFPLVAGLKGRALDDATAREAEDARLEVGQRLGQILAQTVFPPLVGIDGEEREVLDIDPDVGQSFAGYGLLQNEADAPIFHGRGGRYHDLIAFPLLRGDADGGGVDDGVFERIVIAYDVERNHLLAIA